MSTHSTPAGTNLQCVVKIQHSEGQNTERQDGALHCLGHFCQRERLMSQAKNEKLKHKKHKAYVRKLPRWNVWEHLLRTIEMMLIPVSANPVKNLVMANMT